MCNREIIGGGVGISGELIDERSIRIVNNLAVTVIFHHNDEHVIERWDALGYGTLLGREHAAEGSEHNESECYLFHFHKPQTF